METKYKVLLGAALILLVFAMLLPGKEAEGTDWNVHVGTYSGEVIYRVLGPEGMLTDGFGTKVSSSFGDSTIVKGGPDSIKVVLSGQTESGSVARVTIEKNGTQVLDQKYSVPWEEVGDSVQIEVP